MRTAPILAIAILSTSAAAQLTNVLPASANSVAGGSSNAFPWGFPALGWAGLRTMCVYDSSHFTAASTPITIPILITHVKWRANDVDVSFGWTGGTYGQATVSLATAAVDQAAASTVWASNVGPDYTQVYTGPVTVLPGAGNGLGVPGPYIVDIPVNPPFPYDPNAGDLVVDTNWLTGAWGGGSQIPMDVVATNTLARRVYASSFYPNANGVDSAAPVIEITCVPAGPGTFAINTSLGVGCNRTFESAYKTFPSSAAFDLANTAVTFLPMNGGGYLAALGGSFQPVGSTSAPITLALTNTLVVTQAFTTGSFPGWTGISVCSDGFVSRSPGNFASPLPTAVAMLNAAQPAFWSWHDFDPTIPGGGTVLYEESANEIVVTWNGVWDALGTSAANANHLQFQLYPSGMVTIAWGAMSGLGGPHLVGYSPGGPSLNPGSTDFSALAPILIAPADVVPLTLAAVTRPRINSNWSLVLGNIPANAVIGIDVFGAVDPGIVDLGFLGMPGCGLHATLDLLGLFPVVGGSHAYHLSLPSSPSLVNTHLFATSAVFQTPPANAFGAITSNAIDGTIGDL